MKNTKKVSVKRFVARGVLKYVIVPGVMVIGFVIAAGYLIIQGPEKDTDE